MAALTQNKRRDLDVKKLMMSSYEVHIPDLSCSYDFTVKFNGPGGTAYEGGIWNIHVILPPEYPYKSPSIGFCNRLYHPNIDERSGSVCLDVINQTWSPMFDLVNIFEVFLPQLLRYPNASDPLNSDAAALLLDNEEKYNCKVREYVLKYACEQQQREHKHDQDQQKEGSSNNATSTPTISNSHRDAEQEKEDDEEEDEMDDAFDDGASDVSEMSDL